MCGGYRSGHSSETRLVCEFLDVFPEDLPGLPPHIEIEFVIELAPGTESVSQRFWFYEKRWGASE